MFWCAERVRPVASPGGNSVTAQAAERHGRVFLLMYDLSGMPVDKLQLVAQDWDRLEREGLTQSPAYLQHRGHPVLGLWGIGFARRPMTPADADKLINALVAVSAAHGGISILAGVPSGWRTGAADASSDKVGKISGRRLR